MIKIYKEIKHSNNLLSVAVKNMCQLNLESLAREKLPIADDLAMKMLTLQDFNDAVYEIHSLLKCNVDISDGYVFKNYKHNLK